MRRFGFTVGLVALLVPRLAQALPDDPRAMQHRVDIGFTPLYVARFDGGHEGLVQGPIDEGNVAAVGVLLGYAFRPWRPVELRLRGQYIKPFPGRDALADGLHELRATGGVAAVLPLGTPHLELAFAVDAGPAMFRLTELEEPRPGFSASHAAAFTVGWSAAFRGWVTDHTGFWGEAGFGLTDGASAGSTQGIAARWPLQLTFGYADRF